MYAGAITLVGTEAGVGVKLDGQLIASGGDIQLDANGQLRLAEAKAEQGAVTIAAGQLDARGAVYAGTDVRVKTQGDLDNRQTLAAAGRVNLDSGGRLSNHGIVEAGVNPDSSRNATGTCSCAPNTWTTAARAWWPAATCTSAQARPSTTRAAP